MKFIFDATVGVPWVETLRAVVRLSGGPEFQMNHIYDYFPKDVKDEVWIPNLIGGGWLILSGDSGKGKGERLPALCRAHKRTHVLFSGNMHQKAKSFQKMRSIIVLWPQICDTFSAEPGTRFDIQSNTEKYDTFRLVRKEAANAEAGAGEARAEEAGAESGNSSGDGSGLGAGSDARAAEG